MNRKDEVIETIDPDEFARVIAGCLIAEKDGKGFFKLADTYTSPAWKKAIRSELARRGFYLSWISATYAHYRQN